MVHLTTAGKSQPVRGFTYLMLLWWVAISGVMLVALAKSWANQAQREREAELVFRGEQIAAALAAYRAATPAGQSSVVRRLEDLLEDRRQTVVKRHLRQLWPDPITQSPWGLVREGPSITGVFSTSQKTPLSAPTGTMSYQDWRFMASAVVTAPPVPTQATQPEGSDTEQGERQP